jgi:beta-lactamase regulating signal transducer with metallopeptidase domain
MNPSFLFWLNLFGRLAAEAALIVALAVVAQWMDTAPTFRRTVWQAVLVGIALVWAAELAGAREWAIGLQRQPDQQRRLTAKIVDTAVPSIPEKVAMPNDESSLAMGDPAPTAAVWWPLKLWMGGVAVFVVRAVVLRFWLVLAAQRRPGIADPLLLVRIERLRMKVGLRRVRVLSWDGLGSPVAFGIWQPTVALPSDFGTRFTQEAQDAMIAHELAHLAAKDPFWLAVADAVLALSWWHPGVWWARRQLRTAGEAAADEASSLVPGGRIALAESLVTFGRELAPPAWARGLGVAGGGFKSELGQRVTTLLRNTGEWRGPRPVRIWAYRFATTALAATVFGLPLPGSDGPSFPELLKAKPPTNSIPVVGASDIPVDNTAQRLEAGAKVNAETAGPSSATNTAASPHPDGSDPRLLNREFRRQVELSVQFVEITEGGDDDVGLDWLFGQSPTNNPAVLSGPATNLLSGTGAPHGQNLRVDLLRTEGQFATLTPMQFEALQSRLKSKRRVEFLTAPKLITVADRQAHVEVSESKNVVVNAVGISATTTNKASVQYETETIATGLAVDVMVVEQDAGWKLTVLAKSTDFLGYDDPKSAVVTAEQPGQKPLTGQVPLPRLRMREVQAVVPAKNGDTVALRGPLVEEVFRFKDKVVVLGDVPLLGRLFRKEGKTTLHKRLYIFVTPVEVGPDGSRK